MTSCFKGKKSKASETSGERAGGFQESSQDLSNQTVTTFRFITYVKDDTTDMKKLPGFHQTKNFELREHIKCMEKRVEFAEKYYFITKQNNCATWRNPRPTVPIHEEFPAWLVSRRMMKGQVLPVLKHLPCLSWIMMHVWTCAPEPRVCVTDVTELMMIQRKWKKNK